MPSSSPPTTSGHGIKCDRNCRYSKHEVCHEMAVLHLAKHATWRFKWIIVLQLGFENFAQGILYVVVASSQAAAGSGNVQLSAIIGIVQALFFCGFQIFELKDLALAGGADGNPGSPPNAHGTAAHPSPSPPSYPPTTSGGGQSVSVPMSPAASFVTLPSP